jgi:hypothetical protein
MVRMINQYVGFVFNYLSLGDLIPADGLVVQSSDLKVDESSITGSYFYINFNLRIKLFLRRRNGFNKKSRR